MRSSARASSACCGESVATSDRLVGRAGNAEPPLPEEIAGARWGDARGVTEWMVHPGRRDPQAASSFDAAREQDLELVVDLSDAIERSVSAGPHAALHAQLASGRFKNTQIAGTPPGSVEEPLKLPDLQ